MPRRRSRLSENFFIMNLPTRLLRLVAPVFHLFFTQNQLFSTMKSSFFKKMGAVALFVGLAVSTIFAQQMPMQVPTVTVTGTAEIKVVPDEIYLSLAVETKDADLAHAKLASDTRLENAIKFLKQNGVKSADIQTGSLSVRPEYNYNPETGQSENVKFYVINRPLEFKLADPKKFDDLLTGLMEGGVNYVNEIRFCTTKMRENRDKARREAARAARQKADLLTQELGAKTGKVISISEAYQDYYPPMNYGNAYQQNVQMGDGGGAASVNPNNGEGSLSVGLITVSASITASFLIE